MDVLIVEDDDGAAEVLEQTLVVNGYVTRRTVTGTAALQQLAGADLVLLDLGLPDLAGHEVCRRIREQSCVPVIALSGCTDELDRVMALHMGADDFVPKPFGRYELMARIRAVVRRSGDCPRHGAAPGTHLPGPADTPPAPPPGGPRPAGPLRLDPRARRVLLHGEEVRVTRREFDLLAVLLEDPGTVMARKEIMSKVWGENWFGSPRTLDVHVGSLRGKLGSAQWIETVRGIGYRLTVPDRPVR